VGRGPGAAREGIVIPSISVLVSTRDRPEHVAACVRAVLASPDSDFELIVVDQSAAAVAEAAQREVGDDARLRWVSSATRGLSVSRNVGLTATQAPLIAFTDDDCRVGPEWVGSVRRAFQEDPSMAGLFGAVLLRPEDRASGYAAEFEPPRRVEFHCEYPDIRGAWGVGANMAFRRNVFDVVGEFDVVLGAGAPLFAGEETDLTIRALSAGFKIVQTPDISLLHLGIRQGAEAARIMRNYGIGLGAVLGKHVRLGTRGASGLLARLIEHHSRRSFANLLKGHRHPGFGLAAAIVLGASRAYGYRLDAARGVFDPSAFEGAA
jgi:glycosyltransferase involved in cell wall biosynthesis